MKKALVIVGVTCTIIAGVFFLCLRSFSMGYVTGGEDLCASERGKWMQTPGTEHYTCDLPQ